MTEHGSEYGSEHGSIAPNRSELAATASVLRLAAYTLIVTGALLLAAGGLALYYMGAQGLAFLPAVLLVAGAEIAAGIYLRRRARAMAPASPGARDQ